MRITTGVDGEGRAVQTVEFDSLFEALKLREALGERLSPGTVASFQDSNFPFQRIYFKVPS